MDMNKEDAAAYIKQQGLIVVKTVMKLMSFFV